MKRAALLLLCLANLTSFAQAEVIIWENLLPPKSTIVDPFKALTQNQLDDLGYFVGLRDDIVETQAHSPEHPKLAKQKIDLNNLKQELIMQGVDIDNLLAKRELIKKDRFEQANNVNSSVIDQQISIEGFVVPVKVTEDKIIEFFLIQNNPLVNFQHNHTAPPPNQVILVQGSLNLDHNFNKPQRVTGTLIEQHNAISVVMPDGHDTLFESSYLLTK